MTGEESQGLLSATGEGGSSEEEESQDQGDEEEQSRRNAQPGALARIMRRYEREFQDIDFCVESMLDRLSASMANA